MALSLIWSRNKNGFVLRFKLWVDCNVCDTVLYRTSSERYLVSKWFDSPLTLTNLHSVTPYRLWRGFHLFTRFHNLFLIFSGISSIYVNFDHLKAQLGRDFGRLFYISLHRLTNHPSFRCVLVCLIYSWGCHFSRYYHYISSIDCYLKNLSL